MLFKNKEASTYFDDRFSGLEEAFKQTTHLAIGAHQDDIEIMAANGIGECYQNKNKWFSAIVCTNGAGSSRSGAFANFSDQQMMEERRKEQVRAAQFGEYASLAQLFYPSKSVKEKNADVHLKEDLKKILYHCTPEVLYTHNLADKHKTHVGVVSSVIEAIRELPKENRPNKVYGCEVWRNLDWLSDDLKVKLPINLNEEFLKELLGYFKSQISGGKRYDLATLGRMYANATYLNSHTVDTTERITYAMDLTELIEDVTISFENFLFHKLERFSIDVIQNLQRL